jgi:hypothetical protein
MERLGYGALRSRIGTGSSSSSPSSQASPQKSSKDHVIPHAYLEKQKWRQRRTGYYQGRATHWHIRVHPDFEVLPNNTYIGKTLAHTGQLFVQDDINSAVDMMYPYVSHELDNLVEEARAYIAPPRLQVNNHLRTMPGRGRTRNWQDSLNIFEDSQIGGYQSMWDMHYMGSVISQGLQGFITVVSCASNSASIRTEC